MQIGNLMENKTCVYVEFRGIALKKSNINQNLNFIS